VHLAVLYLDIVAHHAISATFSKVHWKEVAMSCLFIAAKFDEVDDNIPISEEFCVKAMGDGGGRDYNLVLKWSTNQFLEWESLLLRSVLGWNLNLLTPLHFLELYVQMGAVFESEEWDQGDQKCKLDKVKDMSYFSCDLAMECHGVIGMLPSVVGLAWVLVGRKLSKVQPVWDPKFEEMYCYKFQDIEKAYESLYTTYKNNCKSIKVKFPNPASTKLNPPTTSTTCTLPPSHLPHDQVTDSSLSTSVPLQKAILHTQNSHDLLPFNKIKKTRNAQALKTANESKKPGEAGVRWIGGAGGAIGRKDVIAEIETMEKTYLGKGVDVFGGDIDGNDRYIDLMMLGNQKNGYGGVDAGFGASKLSESHLNNQKNSSYVIKSLNHFGNSQSEITNFKYGKDRQFNQNGSIGTSSKWSQSYW